MSAGKAGIINERLAAVRRTIRDCCDNASPARDPGDITIVAVSKRMPVEAVKGAYECGIRDFGENFVQEAASKQAELPFAGDCTWHLVGPLQSNKAKQAARLFDWVHTINSAKIARKLAQARTSTKPGPLMGCVQVNLGDEPTKSGVSPQELPDLLREITGLDGLVVRGLMCIPELDGDMDFRRDRFKQLAKLLKEAQAEQPTLDTLSMGMSGDFAEAVAEGATMVRIGTALFGPRP